MHHPVPSHRRTLVLGAALLLAACGGGDPGVQIGPPARIDAALGDGQNGVVGSVLAVSPSVRVADANGRGVAGITVRFDIASGGGTISGGDSVVTTSDGVATVGQWRLGAQPGLQQLRAQAVNFPLQLFIEATAGPGPPASIQAVSGGGVLSAIVNQLVFPAPAVRVRDGFGNPIAGITVTFEVTLGGGTVTGSPAATDAEGRATVGSWRLGPLQGNNRLIARTSNGIIATFNATGVGIPSSVQPASPVDQAGVTNFGVPVVPRVLVRDQQGQPIAGVAVVFTRTLGDGVLQGETAATDNNGIAALGDWRLGIAPNHAVQATVPGFAGPPLEFRSTATPRPFTIDVRFITPMTPNQRDVFIAAALRWMDVIQGDLQATPFVRAANSSCFGETHPAINETIDDVLIFAAVETEDGPGNILGSAFICSPTRVGSGLPLVGRMSFDIVDLPVYEATGRLLPLILHEMGHVLGIGTLWGPKNLRQGAGGSDPIFTGEQAIAAWPQLGLAYAGPLVPIENTGGGGTRDVHWRESVLDRELMTGFIEGAGIFMPLSVLTAASLIDLGYVVNLNASDPFFAGLLRADGTPVPSPGDTRIIEILGSPEGKWLPDGKFVPHN